MKYTESGQLEIGDVVITETFVGKSYFTIDRVVDILPTSLRASRRLERRGFIC